MNTRIASSRGTDPGAHPVTLEVDGAALSLPVAPCVTLLDLLRKRAQLTGFRKLRNLGQGPAGSPYLTTSRIQDSAFVNREAPPAMPPELWRPRD